MNVKGRGLKPVSGGRLANEQESLATSTAENRNAISVTELRRDNWLVLRSDDRKKGGLGGGGCKSDFVLFLGKMKFRW